MDAHARAILIDSSALFAIADKSDARHDEAVLIFGCLASTLAVLLVSNWIIAEAHALLLNRSRRIDQATAFLVGIHASKRVTRARVEDTDERRALEIITRYQDKAFSFTDATSFAIMERLGIQHVFTFDSDFRQYGWIVVDAADRS